MKPLFSRVAILGVGMIGGSFGKALLERGLAGDVVGYDPKDGVLSKACVLGAVTEAAETVAAAVHGCDLVVLAAPVLAAQKLLEELAPHLSPGAIVTDVCSTKTRITRRAAEVLPLNVSFVGGHPMAGSDKAGVEALDANLFENAVYVLCGSRSKALEAMIKLVRGLGALPVIFSPARHDSLVAAVSHLPHLAAAALVQAAFRPEDNDELLILAASGFADTTRVALGSPEMWRDICLSNREHLFLMLERLQAELNALKIFISEGEGEKLLTYFQKSREDRLQLPSREKGILPPIFNLFVYVADRPGIIGEVAGSVGESGVNIAEIELLRVREEEGGPLRLGFARKRDRRLAAGVLQDAGYRVEWQED